MTQKKTMSYTFFPPEAEKTAKHLGKEALLDSLRQMQRIRHFELRAESAYQQGKIGGFFHSYIGQEAIQTAAIQALGKNQWWATSYRCHALALLLGVPPDELMAELYGKATGNALGRGGSMHFFSERLLGGFGIVGGQIPIATGAAFSIKYEREVLDKSKPAHGCEVAVCFLGDGAVVQGAFHESLNLAALWDLPCIYVIENNFWGMGTAVERAVSVAPMAETKAPGYGIKGYSFDGMDFFSCYNGFSHVLQEVRRDSRPVLVEVLTQRFKGHSISDPGLYRTKEHLQDCMLRDPIKILTKTLLSYGMVTEEEIAKIDEEEKEVVLAAMRFAESSPWPDPIHLEEDVLAP
ncbi:MAG: pyruvate dehydrogenase (acetyl-transferring) E1 component subunit alpha [Chlamydiae bacterium]|nr:pyruvate dehydrogenase (acetyl-transferring) E1 component subunit alpha [Chlamydiota bacterium]